MAYNNNANRLKLRTIYDVINHEQNSKLNLSILSSDNTFLDILINDIAAATILVGGTNGCIFTMLHIHTLRKAIKASDDAAIRDSLNKIWGADYLTWTVTPAAGAKPNMRYVHFRLINYNIPISATKMLNLEPRTRVLLGFEGVSFEHPTTGLIDVPAAGMFKMTTEEMDALKKKGTVSTYTGIDISTSIAIGKIITNIRDMKTISYSTHRANAQVRACGGAYIRGISRGPRTIGGSIICTVRLMDPLKFLDPKVLLGYDNSVIESDSDLFRESMLPDQYPLFDMLIMYQNEVGDASALIIYGISIHDSGQTSSVSDTETEVQYVYTAVDIDPIRMLKFSKDGTIVTPFTSDAYLKRKERIVKGITVHGDPYDIPSIKSSHGNISYLDFLL